MKKFLFKITMLPEKQKAIGVAVLALIALILPFVFMGTNVSHWSVNGYVAGSYFAWLTMLSFIFVVVARYAKPIEPFKKYIDMAAGVFSALTIIYALFWHKIGVFPNIGMILLIIALIFLYVFFIKDKK